MSERDHRPWGYYEVIVKGPHYKVKRIVVDAGKRLSLQFHRKRAEHWAVARGRGLVTVGDEKIEVTPGQSVDIPQGAPHRVENCGDEPLIVIELQLGDYLGEDDIERVEDDYGRA